MAILVAGAFDPFAAFGFDPALAVVLGKLLDQVVIDTKGGNPQPQSPLGKMPSLAHARAKGDLTVAFGCKAR